MREVHRRSAQRWAGAAVLVLALLLLPCARGVRAEAPRAGPAFSAIEYVNVSATPSLSFVPDKFTVYPGASVHLTVTQEATFQHTFTLSGVANATISTLAFFHTHPPLVNLTLGTTPGQKFSTVFTAPPVGRYEFVCEVHFPSMTGSMSSSRSTGGAGGSGGFVLTPLDEAVAAGALVVVGAATVVFFLLRRPPPSRPARGSPARPRR